MAIARRPKLAVPNGAAPRDERAAEAFIAGAGKGAVRDVTNDAATEARKTPVMLRFDRDLLKKVDSAAKRRGVSRSSWIQYTVSRALDAGEG